MKINPVETAYRPNSPTYKHFFAGSTSTEHVQKRIKHGWIKVSEFGYYLRNWRFPWKIYCQR